MPRRAASWDGLTSVIDSMPHDRLEEPGVVGEWSVRDLVAHTAGYERYVAAAIFADLTGVPARAPSTADRVRTYLLLRGSAESTDSSERSFRNAALRRLYRGFTAASRS